MSVSVSHPLSVTSSLERSGFAHCGKANLAQTDLDEYRAPRTTAAASQQLF